MKLIRNFVYDRINFDRAFTHHCSRTHCPIRIVIRPLYSIFNSCIKISNCKCFAAHSNTPILSADIYCCVVCVSRSSIHLRLLGYFIVQQSSIHWGGANFWSTYFSSKKWLGGKKWEMDAGGLFEFRDRSYDAWVKWSFDSSCFRERSIPGIDGK